MESTSKNKNFSNDNGREKLFEIYNENGIIYFPIVKKGAKKPPIAGWNKLTAAVNIPNGKNVAILLGNGLIGIDVDTTDPFLWKILFLGQTIEGLAEKTWVSSTPSGGIHVLYKLNETVIDRPIKIADKDGNKVLEFYTHDRFFIEEPSYLSKEEEDEEGDYRWITDIEKVGIQEKNSGWFVEVQNYFQFCERFLPLFQTVIPKWKDGNRHDGALSLVGALRKAGVGKEETKNAIKIICKIACDNEVEDRLRAVEDTFKKDIKEIKGISGVVEIFGEDVANTIAKRLANNSNDERKYLEFNKEGNVVGINGIKKDLLISDLLSDYTFLTLEDSKDILYYNKGVYKFGGAEIISQECERRIPIKYAAEFLSRYVINEIIGHIERKTYIDRSEFDTGNHNLLIVDNGVIDLGTWKFKEHSPDIKALNKLPVKYDPNADCPQIKKFISGVVSPDEIPLVQEFIGYILYPDLPTHKSMWWYGGGRNGKDTLATLITKLIGIDNISYVDLHDLETDRFAPASLYGKLLNISGEVNPAALNRMNIFKAITGGTEIEAQRKYGHRFKFKYRGKIIIFGNQIPLINENTVAFDERLIIVRFPNKFLDNDPRTIKGLSEIISTPEEMSGFLNWALDGLKRLKNNNWIFSISKSSEEMKEEFTRQSNPIRAFINERTEIKIGATITSEELYNNYKAFCEENDLEVKTLTAFGTEIRKIPHVIKNRDKKTHATIYKNIAIIDNTKQSYQSQHSFSLYNYSDDNIHYDDTAHNNGIENYVNHVNPAKNINQLCERVFNAFITQKKEDGDGVLSFSELCSLLPKTDKKEIKSSLKLLEHLNKIRYLRGDIGWDVSDGVDLNAWFQIKGGE